MFRTYMKVVCIWFGYVQANVQEEETIGLKFNKKVYIDNSTKVGEDITKRFGILTGDQGKPTSIVRLFLGELSFHVFCNVFPLEFGKV